MRVSAIQMDVRTRDVQGNMAKAAAAIREAARRKSRLALLPEMWTTGFAYPGLGELARSAYNDTFRFLAENARTYRIWLLGTFPEPATEGVYNTLYWFDPNGDLCAQYRKVHLFTPTREDQHFVPGDRCEAVETEFGKAGGIICFDLRFPELSRKLTQEGARILFVPAQFPHPRSAHWETLLKARAIENQVWVVAANRVGGGGGLEYFGMSMVVDPWGRVLEGEASEREAVVTADIDFGEVDRVRAALPCVARPDVYGLGVTPT